MVDNYENYYIKPADYVIVKVTKDGVGMLMGNEDHTYSDFAGEGRLFILTYGENDTYQWWEVEKKDNLLNAKQHKGRKYVFQTDLTDFYPFIS